MKKKDKLKKDFKKYTWTAISMIIYIFIITILTMIFRNEMTKTLIIIAVITIIVSAFFTLYINDKADSSYRELLTIKSRINEYRIRRNFIKILDLIESNDINGAIDIYTKFIPEKHQLTDYLYPMIIQECKYSNDPKLKEKYIDKITYIRNFYNPDKIKLLNQ